MSVYTKVSFSELKFFFDRYNLGTAIHFEGIAQGIDNSNYFVETTEGNFVLTLFENLTLDELPPFIKLLTHVKNSHIPCPKPQLDKQGNTLRLLNDKPAAIFKRLPGVTVESPTLLHCQQVGLQLAELHDCTQDYKFPITSNALDKSWWLLDKIHGRLSVANYSLIKDELRFLSQHYPQHLPRGLIHGDLFKDNVLFDGDKLSGILDFYSAGRGSLLLDLAITVNDWCCDNGIINPEKVTTLLSAYETLRPLQKHEKQHWQTVLRAAALRFWLCRLKHQLRPRTGEIVQQKDAMFFRQLLEQHRNATKQQWLPTV
jgi:homoserine kinase type II